MYELRTSTKYRRDVRRCKKRGLDLALLNEATKLLIETGTLPKEYGPHPLRGEYVNCTDAHLAPDWVLIYQVHEDDKIIDLKRTGTHADLFR